MIEWAQNVIFKIYVYRRVAILSTETVGVVVVVTAVAAIINWVEIDDNSNSLIITLSTIYELQRDFFAEI